VFTPFVLDTQPDHRRANYIVAEALRKVDWNIRVLGYEVWGFCVPNVIVAIDDVMELKLRALACFEFANRAVNYTWSTQGVNMYRSRFTEVGCAGTRSASSRRRERSLSHWSRRYRRRRSAPGR